MRPQIWLFLFTLLLAATSHAASKMETEVYPLDLMDFETAEGIGSVIVSPDGKLFADKERNRLVLYDYPEKHKALRQALSKLRTPVHHVRIQVAFKEHGTSQSDHFSVNGSVRTGPVTVGTPGAPSDGSTQVNAQQVRMNSASYTQQELLVISGGKAKLRIGTDVPYAEWFWNYGLQFGFWTGGIRWKELGAQMVVEPYVIGDKIRVKLTPEFSYLLDGQTLTTAIQKLTTEVYVQDGQEIDIGGLPVSNQEFYSKFLIGYNHVGEKRSLQITLKPSIETLQSSGPVMDPDRNVGKFRKKD